MNLNEFAPWQCPLCGAPLAGDVSLKCARNHSFDRAKEGYWHLLPVQSMRTKAPGDSKEMATVLIHPVAQTKFAIQRTQYQFSARRLIVLYPNNIFHTLFFILQI